MGPLKTIEKAADQLVGSLNALPLHRYVASTVGTMKNAINIARLKIQSLYDFNTIETGEFKPEMHVFRVQETCEYVIGTLARRAAKKQVGIELETTA